MPAQVKISLSAEAKNRLEKNIKSRKTPVRLLERSRIILLAAEGIPNYKIAERLDIDVNGALTASRARPGRPFCVFRHCRENRYAT